VTSKQEQAPGTRRHFVQKKQKMASAILSRYDDTDAEDDGRSNDGRSIGAATTASAYSLYIAATGSVDASIAAWTQIGEATVATTTSQQRGGWEPFPATNDDESLVWTGTDDGTLYARKSPGGKNNSSARRMMATRTWGNDDDEELPSTEVALAGNDYNVAELKGRGRVKSKNKRLEKRSSPVILRRFGSYSSDDDIQTNNDEGDNESRDESNDDAETTYTRKSWLPPWHDVEPQSAAGNNEVSKRKRCWPPSCHLSFTCHVVIVAIIILVVFLVLLLFFLFQKGIFAWP
jgi:hypothetical protein